MTDLITFIPVADDDGGLRVPNVTSFGADDWSWNLDDPDYQTDDSDRSGRPGIGIVGQAIQTWLALHGRNATVGMIATVFHLPPSLVDQVIADEGNQLVEVPGAGVTVDGV